MFRSFFRSLLRHLRNNATDTHNTVLQVTRRRALGKKKDTRCLNEETVRVCVVTRVLQHSVTRSVKESSDVFSFGDEFDIL